MAEDLSHALFDHVLIPVASESDARTASETILPYLEGIGGGATVVHVVKQTEGGVDPSPASMQAEDADEFFDIVTQDHGGLVVETRTAYGSDVVESIFELADEVDASAIVFSPEEKSRLIRLLTGDTALRLVTEPDVPVLAIPRRE